MSMKLFITFPCDIFNNCMICGKILHSIILNIFYFPFLFLSNLLDIVLSILLTFEKEFPFCFMIFWIVLLSFHWFLLLLEETHWLKPPTLARHQGYFMTGGPSKELSHHLLKELRRGQKETPCVLPPLRFLLDGFHLGWADACMTRKDSVSEWLAKDNPEINLITITPENVSHVAKQFSWVALPSCSLPRHPFPIKSLALSAWVSPWTVHFRMLDKSPLLGPEKGPPSCNSFIFIISFILPLPLSFSCFLTLFFELETDY